MRDRNLILVGFMGTGKTEVGRRLAARLGRVFVDMDAVIEERTGRTIAELFERDGEASFRRRERELVRELAGRKNLVIAAGGGVVLDPDNLRDFERTGVVICLTATAEEILRRVAGQTHRPLLEGGDRLRRIRELLERRRPLYEAIERRVETTGLTVEETVARVLDLSEDAGEGPED